MNMCEDEEVEDDEEEIDVDVCLAACIDPRDPPKIVGVRRSARISAQDDDRASLRVAQLMQEQTEQEAIYLIE
jgi:hypothetical protein